VRRKTIRASLAGLDADKVPMLAAMDWFARKIPTTI